MNSRYKFLFPYIEKYQREGLNNASIAKRLISELNLGETYPALTQENLRKFISKYVNRELDIEMLKIDYSKLQNVEVKEQEKEVSTSTVVQTLVQDESTIVKTTVETIQIPNYINKNNLNNVLVIPDIHLPFAEQKDLDHCVAMKKEYNCGKVIFIGDIVDNHHGSFHTPSLATVGLNAEHNMVISMLKEFNKHFPEAVWILGNHDRIPQRKATEGLIPTHWMRSFNDVYDVEWEVRQDYLYNGVYYNHGETATAKTLAGRLGKPVVSGHRHSEHYIQTLSPGLWGMQVGICFNPRTFAFDYAKEGTQTWTRGCAVVINKTPILLPLN